MLQISEAMLKYYPKHVKSMLNMSTIYVKQNKIDKSIEILIKANSIEPKNAILNYNLAYVYLMKDDKANAKKYFDLVVLNATEKENDLREAARRHLNELK
jgi:Tfp pilus assembly protein PilF